MPTLLISETAQQACLRRISLEFNLVFAIPSDATAAKVSALLPLSMRDFMVDMHLKASINRPLNSPNCSAHRRLLYLILPAIIALNTCLDNGAKHLEFCFRHLKASDWRLQELRRAE